MSTQDLTLKDFPLTAQSSTTDRYGYMEDKVHIRIMDDILGEDVAYQSCQYWEIREFIRGYSNCPEFRCYRTEIVSLLRDWGVIVDPHHWLHYSVNRDGMVAWTPDDKYGEQDRQIVSKIGKYLSRYHPDLSPSMVAEISALVRVDNTLPALHIATDPDDIVDVYKRGPSSCMGGKSGASGENTEKFAKLPHWPVYIYGAGDIGIAYITEGERITARTCVNLKTKEYDRIYGDAIGLQAALSESGYTPHPDGYALIGCRMLRITVEGRGLLAPYLDGCQSVTDKGDHLVIDDDGGMEFDDQYGVCSGDSLHCTDCGDPMSEDDATYIEATGDVCEHCRDNNYVYVMTSRHGDGRYVSINSDHTYVDALGYYVLDDDLDRFGYVMDHNGKAISHDNAVVISDEYYHVDDVYHYIDSDGDDQYTTDSDDIVEDDEGNDRHVDDVTDYEDEYGDVHWTIHHDQVVIVNGTSRHITYQGESENELCA